MWRKSFAIHFVLFCSLALMTVGASTRLDNSPQRPPTASSQAQADCSDEAIRSKVIEALKQAFTEQKRKENFFFDVVSKNKVVTLTGSVSYDKLRKDVLDEVKKTLKQMSCNAKLNPKHDRPNDGKNGIFLSKQLRGCPPGEELCADGKCRTIGSCPTNPLRGSATR